MLSDIESRSRAASHFRRYPRAWGTGSIRTTQEIYSHMIHGHDEAVKKWEEFQNQAAVGEPKQKGRVL